MAKKEKPQRPGMMIYFDMVAGLHRYSDEELGKLIRAMAAYAEHGEYPDLSERLMLVWPFIEQKLDYDGEKYLDTCRSARYATYCKKMKAEGKQPLDKDDWIEQVDNASERGDTERIQLHTQPELQIQPEPQTQPQSQLNSNAKSNKNFIINQKARGGVGEMTPYGEHHKIFLHQEEYNALLNQFDFQKVSGAIKCMDNYIYRTGAQLSADGWPAILSQCITDDWAANGVPEQLLNARLSAEIRRGA